MRPTGNPIQKVRTFADDVRKVQGGDVPPATDMRVPTVRTGTAQIPIPQTGLEREVFDVTTAATGIAEPSIVREGRGDHWSLGNALQNSLSSWFGNKVEKLSSKKATPQVAPSIERASIIRVASKETAMAPQDDHTALVTKLRSYTTNPTEELSLKITPPAVEPPSWSHVTGPSAVTPAPAPAQPVVSTRPRVTTPLPNVPRVPARSEFSPTFAQTTTTEEQFSIPVTNNSASDVDQGEIIGYANANESAPRVRITRTVEEIIPEGRLEKTFTERARERAMQIRETDTEQFSFIAYLPSKLLLYIGAAVLMLFTLTGIGSMGYLALTRGSSDTPIFVPQKNNSLVAKISSRDPLPIGQSRNAFLIDLTKRVREVGGELGQLKEFYFVYPNDEAKQELPADAFLGTLDTHAPGSLVRTITRMAFGVRVAGSNAPFIVFQIRDRDEALGGMLAWEQYLNEDFAPLFGEDQKLIGQPQRQFTDTTISGTDARILRDQNGSTLLIYARIQDLIIMSTSEETVKALTI